MLQNGRKIKVSGRDSSIDAVCGLFIVYMIVTHAFQWSDTTSDSFYTYSQYALFLFMPWFFYKAGMYHRKGDFKAVVRHNAKKLLIPYMAYTIVGELVLWAYLFLQYGFGWRQNPLKEIILKGSCNGNLPLWFLLSFFLVKLTMSLADKYKVRYMVVLVCAAMIAGGGTIIVLHSAFVPLTALSTALGIVFYIAGYYMRKVQYNRNIVIVAGIVFAVITILEPSYIGFRDDSVTKGYWVLGVINAIAGIVLFNNLFKLKALQLPVLTSIGRESMNYYCTHWILFYLTIEIWKIRGFDITGYEELVLLLTSSAIVLPCYSYWSIMVKHRKQTRLIYDTATETH